MWNFGQAGWIGVDIGSACLKIVQLAGRRSAPRLHVAQLVRRVVPWPAECNYHSPPQPSAGELLAALSASPRAKCQSSACSLSMSLCDHRVAAVPVGLRASQRAALAEQLTRGSQFGDTDAAFDFWPAAGDVGAQEEDVEPVNVLAISSPWVTQLIRDFHQARLECRVLDGVPHTLARAMQLSRPSHGVQAALDWGYSGMTLCIAQAGVPQFVRRTAVASLGALRESVAREMQIHNGQAEQLLRQAGLPLGQSAGEPWMPAVWEIIGSQLQQAVQELRRTMSFFYTHLRPLVPDHIQLFGGGALLPGVEEYLSAQIELPVHRWRLPPHVQHSPCHAEAAPLLAGALALSMLRWEDR